MTEFDAEATTGAPSYEYRPGDVANGHVLGEDGVWRLVPSEANSIPVNRLSYWQRYRGRWAKTVLITACISSVGLLIQAASELDSTEPLAWLSVLLTMGIGGMLGGLSYGSLINLLVATRR